MKEGLITCPNCGHEFEISDALTGRIREHLKTELQQEVARREADVTKRAKALREKEDELSRNRETFDEQVAAKLKERLADTERKAAKKAEAQYADRMAELEETLKERDEAITTFRAEKRAFRTKERELAEATEALDSGRTSGSFRKSVGASRI